MKECTSCLGLNSLTFYQSKSTVCINHILYSLALFFSSRGSLEDENILKSCFIPADMGFRMIDYEICLFLPFGCQRWNRYPPLKRQCA